MPAGSDSFALKELPEPFDTLALCYATMAEMCHPINGYQPKLYFLLDADSKGVSLSDGSRTELRKSDGSRATFPRDLKGINGVFWVVGGGSAGTRERLAEVASWLNGCPNGSVSREWRDKGDTVDCGDHRDSRGVS